MADVVTSVEYTGDGSTKTFTVPFEYLSTSYVKVYVDDVLKTNGTHYTFTTDSTIELTTAPALNAVVLIKRDTSQTPLVTFNKATTINADDLNINTSQFIHMNQEAKQAINDIVLTGGVASDAADVVYTPLGVEPVTNVQSRLRSIDDKVSSIISETVTVTSTTAASTLGYTAINMVSGGQFVLSAGVTFTIDVPFSGGLGQWFEVSASGASVMFADGAVKEVYPEWWGAVLDCNGTTGNGTDNTTAINNALASGATRVRTRAGSGTNYGYRTTGTIVCPVGVDFIMDAPVYYDGATDEPAITVGDVSPTATTRNSLRTFRLQAVKITKSTWSSEDCVGIQIGSSEYCKFDIDYSYGFTIGVQLLSQNAKPIQFCTFNFGLIFDNQIAVDLKATHASGWINENDFYNGNLTCSSSSPLNVSRYGVRIGGTSYYNNNNRFHGTGFQLNATRAGSGEAIPVVINYGNYNLFHDCRNESNSPTGLRVANSSRGNYVYFNSSSGGYTPEQKLDDLTVDTTLCVNTVDFNYLSSGYDFSKINTVFQSGFLPILTNYYDSVQQSIPGLFLATVSNGTKHVYLDVCTITANYIELSSSRAVGAFIDTKRIKRFVVRKSCESGYGGRVMVQCFDADGNIMDGAATQLVQFTGATWHATYFGGRYSTGSDSDAPLLIKILDDTVDHVSVMLCGGTERLRLRSFSLHSFSTESYTSSAFSGFAPPVNVSAAEPEHGLWQSGQRVAAFPPTTGQPAGWVAYSADTDGTAGAYGYTRANSTRYSIGNWALWTTGTTVWECTYGGAIRENSTAYVVDDQIMWSSGTSYWRCIVAGTTAAVRPSIVGTVVGDTVVDGTVTWQMTAGIAPYATASSPPDITGLVVGDTITDGDMIWTKRSDYAVTWLAEGNLT